MLQVNSLTCRRGGQKIFSDVGFVLEAGHTFLIKGANGVGKSSLLRMLAGLLPSPPQSIMWKGCFMENDPDIYKENLHYIGHLDAIKHELTVREMLDYWRALIGVGREYQTRSYDPFGLAKLMDTPIRYLSAGQKRRLTLSRLVLKEAPLWLLDEPMTALDREGQDILQQCVKEHSLKGGIAIIASHQDLHLDNIIHYEMRGER